MSRLTPGASYNTRVFFLILSGIRWLRFVSEMPLFGLKFFSSGAPYVHIRACSLLLRQALCSASHSHHLQQTFRTPSSLIFHRSGLYTTSEWPSIWHFNVTHILITRKKSSTWCRRIRWANPKILNLRFRLAHLMWNEPGTLGQELTPKSRFCSQPSYKFRGALVKMFGAWHCRQITSSVLIQNVLSGMSDARSVFWTGRRVLEGSRNGPGYGVRIFQQLCLGLGVPVWRIFPAGSGI